MFNIPVVSPMTNATGIAAGLDGELNVNTMEMGWYYVNVTFNDHINPIE